jgi:hypothetical protein
MLYSKKPFTLAKKSQVFNQFSRLFSSYTTEDFQKHLSSPPYVLPDHKKIVSPPMVFYLNLNHKS